MTLYSSRTPFPIGHHGMFPREEMLEIGKHKKQLIIGIPKETNRFENRIPLSPQGVEMLVENGHVVIIESSAGEQASYFDKDFLQGGATLVTNKADIYRQADIILKVMPPGEEEMEWLRPDQVIFSFVSLYHQTREGLLKLMDKRLNVIGYEYLRDGHGILPVIRIMNEIEGYASVMIASEYLSKVHNGKGVLLGGITGISPAEFVILGAGTAGEYAARAALGLGAQVKIFDNSIHNLYNIEHNLGQKVFTSVLHPQVITKALRSADAVIGNLGYSDIGRPYLVSEEQLAIMKKGSVIVDLSIAQGGCFESSLCTNSDHPVYTKHGIIHYCVPNIASRVSRTASIALSNIFAPLLLSIADAGGIHQAIKEEIGISNGMYIYKGILTNNQIGKRFGIPDTDIGLLLAAF